MNKREITQNVLLLLKLDSKRLYDRVKFRSPEYLSIFSAKRTREHFKEIFSNRYNSLEIKDLKYCGEEVINQVDEFYYLIDEMKWYLNTTEDMPNTVDDKIHQLITKMNPKVSKLHQAIDSELQKSLLHLQENDLLQAGGTLRVDEENKKEPPSLPSLDEVTNLEENNSHEIE